MIKGILLASCMIAGVPAFAQDAPNSPNAQPTVAPTVVAPTTAPQTQAAPPAGEPAAVAETTPPPATTAPAAPNAAPVAAAPVAAAPAAAPAQTASSSPAQAAQTAPSGQPAQPAQPPQPATTRATTPDQVTQAVNTQFGKYDADGNGTLSVAEFGAWMAALRTASEPGFVATSPEAVTWTRQAFGLADADRNSVINPTELATFLTPKPAS